MNRSIMKYVICFVLSIAWISTLPIMAAPTDIVNIPDPYFKAALNTELHQAADADITEAQMELLSVLNLLDANISDITGIEYATNLTTLLMRENNVTNLEPLKGLKKIDYLALSGTNITSSNFPDLSQNTTLKSLSLSGASVDNAVLTKVNKISSLTLLRFESNYNITTIEPLTVLPNLQELWLQFCGVADFTPINDMSPTLVELYAHGQNTGRLDPETELDRTLLTYDETNQTMFIPFSIMPNVKTNFNGDLSPFTTSTSPSSTYLSLNNVQITQDRLFIDETGIFVSDVTFNDFFSIDKMEYNARYDLPAGTYATPPNFTFYSIASGTYDHYFNVVDRPIITAITPIYYWQNHPVSESTFLVDSDAKTNDNSPITTDFMSSVDFTTPGSYFVTLNATDGDGTQAIPIQVEVIVLAQPTLISKDEVTYYQYSDISEQEFFNDVEATTELNNLITSDFINQVNFDVVGDYQVQIIATNPQGISSLTKLVTVHILPRSSLTQFKLSFNLNGGTGEVPLTQTLNSGDLAVEPVKPFRDGYDFLGWNTSVDGSQMMWDFSQTRMPANNTVLYAMWQKQGEPVSLYELNFNLNGGTGQTPGTQLLKPGSLASEPTMPTRSGYSFKGWNTKLDGTGMTWMFASSMMPASHVTLYAQWEPIALPETGLFNVYALSGFLVLSLGVALLLVKKKTL